MPTLGPLTGRAAAASRLKSDEWAWAAAERAAQIAAGAHDHGTQTVAAAGGVTSFRRRSPGARRPGGHGMGGRRM